MGVLLAAGQSRRMGTPKQLLPWPPTATATTGGGTVVAAAFDAISPWCERMIVVLGHRADEIIAALGSRRFEAVQSDPEAEMIESIKAGIRKAAQIEGSSAVLLHPADVPAVAVLTIKRIVAEARQNPDAAIMPQFQGKGGHPVLFPRTLFGPIESHNEDGGLRTFWLANPDRCVRLEFDDRGCIEDLDTASDYQAATQRPRAR